MKIKQVFKTSVLLAVILAAVALFSGSVFAADTYQISFKGGSHGTISYANVDQGVSYEVDVPYDTNLDTSQIRVNCESGWYCTGWSPEVENPVTERATYVAQYKRIINEAVYHVHYVDTFGNELATQSVKLTQSGVSVTEYAPEIAGYAVDQPSKTVTVVKPKEGEKSTEITFVYTSTAEPTIVDQIQTVVVPGGTTVTTTGGATAGTAANADGALTAGTPGTDANAVNQAGETTTVDDNDVPLANQQLPKNNNQQALPTWFLPMAAIGVLLILGSVIYLIISKKRRKE